jgi:predicted transcriptional regulator
MMTNPLADEATCCPPAAPEAPVPATVEARNASLAAMAKALGHPTRVAILRQLRSVDCFVNDIVGELMLAQSTVSQHLKVLKEAGMVRGTSEGPRVCYCIEPGALGLLLALLEEL